MRLIIAAFLLSLTGTLFAQTKQIVLEDIFASRKFFAANIDGFNSMKNGKEYTLTEHQVTYSEIKKFDYVTGKESGSIFSSETYKPKWWKGNFHIEDYSFSKDESKILFYTGSEAIFRHSFASSYFLFDLKTNTFSELLDSIKVQLAEFSPDGSKVAFVKENDLFVKDLKLNTIQRITNDGKRTQIINGAPDWVYEEEFGFSKAWAWNEDGSQIMYYRFDESLVPEYNMQTYNNELYPGLYTFKYPKAGEKNSEVSIYIYDLKKQSSTALNIGEDSEQYIPRVQWTKDKNKIFVARLNRLQNNLEVLCFNTLDFSSKIVYSEKSTTYVDIFESDINMFRFSNDGASFYIRSDKDGFNHIYRYNMEGKLLNQITKGNFDVMEFYGVDAIGAAYYQSTEINSIKRTLYKIKSDGTGKQLLGTEKGTNDADFNNNFTYYVHTNSDGNTAPTYKLCDANGKEIRVLEDNSTLKNNLKEYDLTSKEFFTFKTSIGVELNAWMMKPKQMKPGIKHPVFLTYYGGPGKNEVVDQWGSMSYLWHQMLVQKGYIVVCVDNRGTQAKGAEFKKCTYKQLGKLEVEDQIEAAKYLGGLEYIDKSRIACMGWSYGGYLTALCMTKGADFFKVGVCVAPVTTWRYYDSIYSERFLQTPELNPTGYDENSPINFVKNLKGKFLLMHGTGDDNVHFQNSVEFVSACVKLNKQIDVMYYPDKSHGIRGNGASLHLYTKMLNFLNENL